MVRWFVAFSSNLTTSWKSVTLCEKYYRLSHLRKIFWQSYFAIRDNVSSSTNEEKKNMHAMTFFFTYLFIFDSLIYFKIKIKLAKSYIIVNQRLEKLSLKKKSNKHPTKIDDFRSSG